MPSPLILPAGYRIEQSREGYALHSDHFGEIGEGDFGCWASACAAAIDHADEMADEADSAAPRAAIADFLHALDRGDFGDLRIGPSYDRAESAYITALRQQVRAPTSAQREAA